MPNGNRNDKMQTNEFEKYTTKYQQYIIKRFSETASKAKKDYDLHGKFICVLEAPEAYEVENEMLTFGLTHSSASLDDFLEYFMKISPPGLPPCASEWEDNEEDDEE